MLISLSPKTMELKLGLTTPESAYCEFFSEQVYCVIEGTFKYSFFINTLSNYTQQLTNCHENLTGKVKKLRCHTPDIIFTWLCDKYA